MKQLPPIPRSPQHGILRSRIDLAIDRLKSLYGGEAALVEIINAGADAIPSLRDLLFTEEPSGLHQPRCRAAEALAALGAFDVLADFLRTPRQVADPVERLGEDTVISTAARAIARRREEWVYRLLVDLAARRPLSGILAGLGAFHCKDAIPLLVDALGEDDVRLTAEAVLRDFGKAARPALIAAALGGGIGRSESESRLRKRRSALGLVLEIGVSRKEWARLRPLLDDNDLQVALLACRICFEVGDAKDRPCLSDRLASLRGRADWLPREQIDDLLTMIGTTALPKR